MLAEFGFDYFGGVFTTSGPDTFKTQGLRRVLSRTIPVGSARPHISEEEFQVTGAPELIAMGKIFAVLPIKNPPIMAREIGAKTGQKFDEEKPIALFASDVMVDVMGPQGWRPLLKPKVSDPQKILDRWDNLMKYRDTFDTVPFRARVGFAAAIPGSRTNGTVGVYKQRETFFNVRPINPEDLEQYVNSAGLEQINRTNGGFDWLQPPFSSSIVTIDNMPVTARARSALRHQLRAVPQFIGEIFYTLGRFHHSVVVEGRKCLGGQSHGEIHGFLKQYPFLANDREIGFGTWLRMHG